jgi:hypothetical protein
VNGGGKPTVNCPQCRDEGWRCESHPDQPLKHDGCDAAGMPCTCDIGLALEQRLDERYRPNVATGGVLWRLEKGGNKAAAITRPIPGVGVELRYEWNGDLRQSHVNRNSVELAAAASEKREELLANGWRDLPPIVWGN